jgi:hypothetical protein
LHFFYRFLQARCGLYKVVHFALQENAVTTRPSIEFDSHDVGHTE